MCALAATFAAQQTAPAECLMPHANLFTEMHIQRRANRLQQRLLEGIFLVGGIFTLAAKLPGPGDLQSHGSTVGMLHLKRT
jgi:hypothetical protein